MAPRKKTSRRSKGGKTRRRRMRGGNVAELRKIVDNADLKPTILFPESKFVVVTYWWGSGNQNANLQEPCPEIVREVVMEGMEEELVDEDPEYKELFTEFDTLMKKRKEKEGLTPEEKARLAEVTASRQSRISQFDNTPEKKKKMRAKYAAKFDEYRQEYKAYLKEKETNPSAVAPFRFRESKTYDEMIDKWNKSLVEMKCNYLSVHYPRLAQPDSYQTAINAKPVFIKKALEVCEGRGVLYIDGDMFIRKYPKIFDMPNIDFAARSWNFDPRSSRKFKEDICFDPYIFETSGGTMFFGNTDGARSLLDAWAEASSLKTNEGKADDRILSQIFTVDKYAPKLNVIHLPIEYLWLTDNYELYDFTIGSEKVADIADCVIEHPYCLTGEERAAELSASSTSRQPVGYDAKISDVVACNTQGGTFYEYIYFPKQDMVDSFGPYLKYIKNAVTNEGNKVFEVVEFSDRYGRYSALALKNLADARAVDLKSLGATATELKLPLMPPLKHVLAGVMKGLDVFIGSEPPAKNIEFSARNIGAARDPYLVNIKIDHSSSMYISGKNPVIMHLLAMCKTLEDVNIHLKESFMFLSRIRWSLRKAGEEAMRIPGLAKKKKKSLEML